VTRREELPPQLSQDRATLQRLGVQDLKAAFQQFLDEGHPRNVDRFLLWLKRRGVLSVRDLCEVHTSRPVTLSGAPATTAEGRPPTVGAQVERRYEVLTELGRGGMGAVYLARDKHLRRPVALKVLLDDASDWVAHRFVAEAKITAQLDHPNIVPCYALDHTRGGQPALTMKVVQGQNLHDLIGEIRGLRKAGRPRRPEHSLEARLEVFTRVCEGMAYAHERRVLHRDLKPENLMVGRHGAVYIMDWGIAKVLDGAGDVPEGERDADPYLLEHAKATQTQAGTVVGTPAYMSPEQANAEPLTPASDQYALGLVLFELVTLDRAIEGTTLMETVLRAMEGETRKLEHSFGDRIHPDLKAIIRKATAPEPEARYADVTALAEDVRRFLRHEETEARPDSLLRRARRWASGHPGLLGGALVLALVTLVILLGTGISAVSIVKASAAAHEAFVTATVSDVARRSHDIDTRLLRTQAVLDRVGAAAEQLWNHGSPQEGPLWHRADFVEGESPPDFRERPYYRKPVSLEEPVTLVPETVDFAAVEAEVRRLHPLRTIFRDAMIASEDAALLDAPASAQERLLGAEGAPAGVVYVGLENGILINFPGYPDLPEGYDPRARPWYKNTEHTRGSSWGELYKAASGFAILLPCNRALYDRDGRMFGVVGLDMTLDKVVELLAMEGARAAHLLDAEGRIVVSTTQAGLTSERGLHGNQALERSPHPEPTLREAIQAAPSGLRSLGGTTYVWNRLGAVEWTYVVELDEPGWF
jgi:eukaryotic-like serine/threonine-protein kinase